MQKIGQTITFLNEPCPFDEDTLLVLKMRAQKIEKSNSIADSFP